MARFESLTLGRWQLSIRRPEGTPPHPVSLLFHGLTGDELAMGIFAAQIPLQHLVISPRALYDFAGRGYSWLERKAGAWPSLTEFEEPATRVLHMIAQAASEFDADFANLHLMGFSQGAALTYALSFQHPEIVASLSALAGFLPTGTELLARERLLAHKPAFVTHGSQDERVPVARARHAVKILKEAGAEVTYCEEDVGHKLSAGCFRALGKFFSKLTMDIH